MVRTGGTHIFALLIRNSKIILKKLIKYVILAIRSLTANVVPLPNYENLVFFYKTTDKYSIIMNTCFLYQIFFKVQRPL